jgi:hypothetical protein
MESYVKEQFTKAIAICGDKPEYENVKDFMQDMIDENIAMKAKDTPSHMLKFLHNAAYNQKFSLEFRDCIQNVVFERQIDDQATTFLVRKLRILCDTREEDIKKKDERIHELESEQLRKSEFKSICVAEELVDELKKRLEENEKRIKVCELEELVDELEKRVEKLREINDKLLEENYDLREKIGEYEYPTGQ